MRRLIAFAPLAALAALAVLFVGFGLRHDPHYIPEARVGQVAPAIVLPDLDTGRPIALAAQLRGPTLVNFFFSTCPPCVEEAPALMALKDQGVRLVGVAYKEPPTDTKAFLIQHGNPFATVLVDRDGRGAIDWGVSGAPETFVVDSRGRIVAKHSGALAPADAEALLEKLQSASSVPAPAPSVAVLRPQVG